MIKKPQLISLMVLVFILLINSCAPKPTTVSVAEEEKKPPVVAPKVVPTTGEASVDEVATDVSDAVSVDDELDTSELDDIDSILTDIENI